DFFRYAAGPGWRPTEIHLEGPAPPHADELRALATKRVVFDQPSMVMVFPAGVLRLRYPAVAVPRTERAETVPGASFESSVRQMVVALLKLGITDVRSAAEAAGMRERSFQRRLAEARQSFSRLVEQARFDAACTMLRDPAVKVVDVSAQLGY